MSISHDELKRLYAANQQSKNDFHERLANAAWERMSPFDKQRLGVQRIKLYEFLDLMGEIFGDKLPILIPTAVNLEECTRIPIVKWKSITQNIQGEERIVWMRKLEQAVCGGGCVQIRLGSHSSHLCLLDIDHDDLVEPLLQANPILQTTLQTYGSKGRHIWFFAEGDYPVKKKRILCDEKVLELLTENSLCTIWGTHYKTGQQYQMIHKATPILFNLDNLKLPAGFAWESKVSSNGQRKGTFTGGFRANSSSGTSGKIDWKSYDIARVEEPEIVEFLVEEYFVANKQERPDGTYTWRCGNICGDPPRDGKQGSFEIDNIGRCTEWADESHCSIMQAITSEAREERITYQDAFTFLAEQGYNFFMATVTFPDLDKRPQTICYDEDFTTCEGRDYPAGVYQHGVVVVEDTKGKKEEFPTDDKICQPIKPVAETYTKEIDEHSLLVEILPTKQSEWKKILIPKAALIATRSDEVSTLLANAGANIVSGNWRFVRAYVEHLKPESLLTEVKRTGWVDDQFKTFILPHRMLGDITKTYFDPGLESVEYETRGVQMWRSGGVQSPVEEVMSPAIICLCYEALCEWHFAQIDSSQATIAESMSLARELNDTHALALALYFTACLGRFERNPSEVERCASDLIELSTRQNFAFWLAMGSVLRGWVRSASGETAEGLSWIEDGIKDIRATGSMLWMPYLLALKAESLFIADRTSEALVAIREAEALAERSEERWWCAELHRLRGVFLAAIGSDDTQIETSFREAISTAKEQKSVSLEKRAEGTYAEYRRQKASASEGRGFRLPLW